MRDPKDILINGIQLSTILENHRKWLLDKEGGVRADLRTADLSAADLSAADLRAADLSYADLSYADLSAADLRDANLRAADLSYADLSYADLSAADLRAADLSYADLSAADLRDANLSAANLSTADLSDANLSAADLSAADLRAANLRAANLSTADLSDANLSAADLSAADLRAANLRAADLSDAKNIEFAEALVTIVSEGDIIGWKKLRDGLIAKLLIPSDARRSNATGRKCRAEFAKVLEIWDGDKPAIEGTSQYDFRFEYHVGKIVRPDHWDENRWEECAGGIHFFVTRIEAEKY